MTMKGMISFNPHGCKLIAMLPNEEEIRKLIEKLKEYGIDIKVELLSRCG